VPSHRYHPRIGPYRTLARSSEFRALYTAQALSLAGDQVARIAVALAVFDRTHSTLLTAVTYSAPYLAWLTAGPLLSTLADRLPRRRLMVTCDALRVALVLLMVLTVGRTPLLLALLIVVCAVEPAFKSARAALLPRVTPGETYAPALSLFSIAAQLAQVVGFAVGGAATAAIGVRGALLFDAATFGASALLVLGWVRERPVDQVTKGALASVAEAARMLWEEPKLRAVLALTWCGAALAIVPEGLAVVYAKAQGAGATGAGLLTAAVPAGTVVGAVLVSRLHSNEARERWLRPLAVLTFVPLLLAAIRPGLPGAFILWFLCGSGISFTVIAYQLFTTLVPDSVRGRAYGLASTGLLAVQGVGLLVAGAIGERVPTQYVVAGAGGLGLLVVTLVCVNWPAAGRARRELVHSGEAAR
jgi:predicted MFS family arabinose efflux permease